MKKFPFKLEGWVHPIVITAKTEGEAKKQFNELLKSRVSVRA